MHALYQTRPPWAKKTTNLELAAVATALMPGADNAWVGPSEVTYFVNGQPVISKGPRPPFVGFLEGSRTLGFAGSDGDVYRQEPAGLLWNAPIAYGVPGTAEARPVFSESLLYTMIAWTWKTDGQAMWTTYLMFQESPPPAPITGVLTDDPHALAYSLEAGYLLAFRGQDGRLYMSSFDAQSDVWAAPELMFGGIEIASAPSMDSGHQGTEDGGELAFVTASGGEVFHSRLVNGTWTDPVLVGGTNMKFVSIQAALWY